MMQGKKRQKSAKVYNSSGSSEVLPGLPDELALGILSRLPRTLQARRRLLCHAWKDAMEPARMASLRKTLNISEVWPVFASVWAYSYKNDGFLFTIVDPLCGRRHNISIPPQLLCHLRHRAKLSFTLNFTVLGAVGTEVLIAAMASPMSALEAEWLELQGVYSFDGLSMKWGESVYSPLPTNIDLRYRYASALDMDGGYLYVAGGYGQHRGLQGAERLDVKTRIWEVLPDPHVKRACATGEVLKGLFYLIGGGYERIPGDYSSWEVHNSGEIWDPESKEWTLLPELWPLEVFGKNFDELRVVVSMDRLYALRRAVMSEELMYYDVSSKLWLSMGHVSLGLTDAQFAVFDICLLAMDQELWVVIEYNRECLVTKPTFGQPPTWRALPSTTTRCLPTHRWKMMGVLQV